MAYKKKLNIIIFGASGAVGNYILDKFYREKHNLLLFVKDKKKILTIKKRYKPQLNQKIFFENLDVIKKGSIKKKFLKNKKFINKTNILINTIGEQGEIKNFFKMNIKKFLRTYEINFFSNIFLFKNLYPLIKNNKNLLILLFSGGGATNLRKNFSSYSLSKVALVKLVEILSVEFSNKNIRINAISPGIINSKMTKIILNKNKFVSKNEINKIKKQISSSNKNLEKIYDLIDFLYNKKGKNISGKMISSRWDNVISWSKSKIDKLVKTDLFTLRRNGNI